MRGEEDVCQSGMFGGEEEWGGGWGGGEIHPCDSPHTPQ